MASVVISFERRVAVITGGAQGIGFAIARRFIEFDARVVIADVDGDAAVAAASSLGDTEKAIGRQCDVTSLDSVTALVDDVSATWGRLDTFVNNAGITRDATIRKMTEQQFDEVIAVHLRGTWNGVRAASIAMRALESPGAIVNMSSISGKVGLVGQTNYSAAKAGIVGLTKAAAKELGHAGIRVNAVMPGLISTPMTDALSPEVLADKLRDVALGRSGRPEEVADAVLFLSSPFSSYVTGVVLEVAGGRHV